MKTFNELGKGIQTALILGAVGLLAYVVYSALKLLPGGDALTQHMKNQLKDTPRRVANAQYGWTLDHTPAYGEGPKLLHFVTDPLQVLSMKVQQRFGGASRYFPHNEPGDDMINTGVSMRPLEDALANYGDWANEGS